MLVAPHMKLLEDQIVYYLIPRIVSCCSNNYQANYLQFHGFLSDLVYLVKGIFLFV